MKYLSVCSGIEAATCAWHQLGFDPFAFSEIEKFPSQVLAHHYPSVPNLGDMTKFEEWQDATIDLLVGGTPCQSFSVAGLRKGLADPRGNLMLTYGAIARRYRPKWLVWENVPGVLSSNGGRDFGTFLGMLGQLGYGFAYRVLDAQYLGVAQRRRRVFVVGCLGDWRGAAAVLFERHSLQGNPAPIREAREVAPTIPSRSSAGGGLGTDFDCDGGLIPALSQCITTGTGQRYDPETETILPVTHSLRGEGFDASEDGTGRGTPLVPVAFAIQAGALRTNPNSGPDGVGVQADHAYTLEARAEVQAVAYAVALRGREGGATAELGDEVQNCLRASSGGGDKPHVLCETLYNKGLNHGGLYASTQETHTGKILRTLREAVGEEAFAQWGLGILGSLQSPEILRQALHGISIRPAAFSRSWVVHCALSRSENGSGWLLQSLREAGCERCASQGWEPSEQLAGKLGAYLSELSQPGAQASRFVRDLWWAAQGPGLLREALSAVQEVGRPTHGQSQPAHGGMQVRRLTVEECEFLQGFPRGYTAIPWRKKPASDCPDGPRYKALGNSMAVPVMAWIGRRIAEVDAVQREARDSA